VFLGVPLSVLLLRGMPLEATPHTALAYGALLVAKGGCATATKHHPLPTTCRGLACAGLRVHGCLCMPRAAGCSCGPTGVLTSWAAPACNNPVFAEVTHRAALHSPSA
jgi:hypothetical protein